MKSTVDFWENHDIELLIREFGTPLYVYNENILRKRCQELKSMVRYPNFVLDYSMKANSNPALMKILRQQGCEVDVMSPGEIYIAEKAGFTPEEMFFVSNNVSEEEMKYAIDRGIRISVDSLSQLEQYGHLAPRSSVSLRINPGIGAGHHSKVITGGKTTKFGINMEDFPRIQSILQKYQLKVAGINQHIGSLFLESDAFLDSADLLLKFCHHFPDLEFIDFGGGFGIPYKPEESRLDLKKLGNRLDDCMDRFAKSYGRKLQFRIEPGRYLVAESGCLLGKVFATKSNHSVRYIGTDIGFNTFMRPILYNSYHEIEIYRDGIPVSSDPCSQVTIVGNICESGDILARNRNLPQIRENDTICVKNAGAYGYVMSSNYNSRLRPAEVLLKASGEIQLIRRRDSYEQLIENCLC